MRVYRRRRVYTIVLFLGVIGLIFLGFQVLYFQALNLETKEKLIGSQDAKKSDQKKTPPVKVTTARILTKKERKAQKDAIVKVVAELDKPKKKNIDVKEISEMEVIRNKIHLQVRQIREISRNRTSNLPRGISPQQIKNYQPNEQGMFRCLVSGQDIPFDHVNDDYCDCDDGTDEPGTSACGSGKFYCQFQLDLDHLAWIWSSKVNDGICDCCDASDEWDGPELPPHVALHDGKLHGGVYQWPCPDHCHELVEDVLINRDIQAKGGVIRRQYIAEAKDKANPNGIYGDQGQFFPLSYNCFYMDSDKYGYEVCPFQEARQTFQGTTRIIGRNHAEWEEQGPKRYRLKMGNGDSNQCPMLKSRITYLDFNCGLDNKVISVQETEVCEYTIKFDTPAACSSDTNQGHKQ